MKLPKLIKGKSFITGLGSSSTFANMDVLCHVISNDVILAKFSNNNTAGYEDFYLVKDDELWAVASPESFTNIVEGAIISVEWQITELDEIIYGAIKPMRLYSEQTTF
jgi:hypothetical protein